MRSLQTYQRRFIIWLSREQFAEMLIPTIFILNIVLTLLMCKKEKKINQICFFFAFKICSPGPRHKSESQDVLVA